ncbi:MAG: PEGA domain-containing protein [candidate division WOR-3 bacterium]|nr:PEGA domain-containing protein [candidate division WOR-3 bacterium]
MKTDPEYRERVEDKPESYPTGVEYRPGDQSELRPPHEPTQVFDSVRIGTIRTIVIAGATVVVLAATLVLGLYSAWPPFLQPMRDWLWPPAACIGSFPPGADLIVDSIPRGRTPTRIAKLAPGEHVVWLALPGFDTIRTSLFVPSKTSKDTTVVRDFSFEIPLDFRTIPESAWVIWDSGNVELGKAPRSVRAIVRKDPIPFCFRDSDFPLCDLARTIGFTQRDTGGDAFVRVSETLVSGRMHWQIQATFYADVPISVEPRDANIRLGDSVLGLSGGRGTVRLGYGRGYVLSASSSGYTPRTREFDVLTGSPGEQRLVLSCPITVWTCAERVGPEYRIAGRIRAGDLSVSSGQRVSLPKGSYPAVVTAPDFETLHATLIVQPNRPETTLVLLPGNPLVEIAVRDRQTGEPVRNAYVGAGRESATEAPMLGSTDTSGLLTTRQLEADVRYRFWVQPPRGRKEHDKTLYLVRRPTTKIALWCDIQKP